MKSLNKVYRSIQAKMNQNWNEKSEFQWLYMIIMNWLDNVSKYYITKFIIKKKIKTTKNTQGKYEYSLKAIV